MIKQFSNVSKLLEMAIKRYQVDVVGWTKFCTKSTKIKRKALASGPSESLEMLRVQDKLSTPLDTPSVKKIYGSKNTYIK